MAVAPPGDGPCTHCPVTSDAAAAAAPRSGRGDGRSAARVAALRTAARSAAGSAARGGESAGTHLRLDGRRDARRGAGAYAGPTPASPGARRRSRARAGRSDRTAGRRIAGGRDHDRDDGGADGPGRRPCAHDAGRDHAGGHRADRRPTGAPVTGAGVLPEPRVPRLGLRFLVVCVTGLLLAGAGILVVVERALAGQAERQAVANAKTIAAGDLDGRLRPQDLRRPLGSADRRRLEALLSHRALGGTAVAATLYARSGRVVASAGDVAPDAHSAVRAASGTTVAAVTSLGRRRVLRTLLPVRLAGGARGVVEVDQDYGALTAGARRTSIVVAAILEGLLLGLCLLLLPTLARASRRLREHVAELDRAATHDELTGLLDRRGFRRRLEAELAAENVRGAALLVDLEQFHDVNETIGTRHADAILADVARRLTGSFPVAARLGEDEFALLLPGGSPAAVVTAAAKIASLLAEPFAIGSIRLQLACRVGAARYPEHGVDADEVMRRAAVALTHAKKGVERTVVYEAAHDHGDRSRLQLAGDVAAALRNGEIVVHYQPQIALVSGRMRAVEALVRWEHPQRGLIPAVEFVEVAEQSALIADLSRYVLATAVGQWRLWHEQGLTLDVAVNLSTVDLLDVELPSVIAELLIEHEMPADHLVIEITERTLLGRDTGCRALLELNRLGVALSVDDFGTGYSSLALLQTLPIAQVKIDRCFVRGLPEDTSSDKIVAGTINLAHGLGAAVVAEGIETKAQLRRLTVLGCDSVQGYLLGRPQPGERIAAAWRRSAAAQREASRRRSSSSTLAMSTPRAASST